MSASSLASIAQSFELGRLHAERGDFLAAIPLLEEASAGYLGISASREYLDCQGLLLKIFTEMEDGRRNRIRDEIQAMALKGRIELDAKTFYSLAFCASHHGDQDDAWDYLNKALALAEAESEIEDLAYVRFGMASVALRRRPADRALATEHLALLDAMLERRHLPSLVVPALMLRAQLALEEARFEEALELAWRAQEALKNSKSLVQSLHLFGMLGAIHFARGDTATARVYFRTLSKAMDRDVFRRLARMVDEYLAKLSVLDQDVYDLRLDFANQTVVERTRGRIDLKQQNILLDLLRLLTAKPGHVFSKEDLVNSVWGQSYDPGAHDNKVYVTIKRLRRFIEPNEEQPKYVIRAKDGYYLNPSVKIKMDEIEGGS